MGSAASRGCDVVALPEKWNGTGDAARMVEIAEPLDGRTVTAMASWARRHGIWLIGGSISERVDGDAKIRNTCVVLDPEGEAVASYRKVHLFDVDLPSGAVRESDSERPGEEAVLTEIAGWPVGLTICYDLRFPELYRALDAGGRRAADGAGGLHPRDGAATTGRCCCGRARSRTAPSWWRRTSTARGTAARPSAAR